MPVWSRASVLEFGVEGGGDVEAAAQHLVGADPGLGEDLEDEAVGDEALRAEAVGVVRRVEGLGQLGDRIALDLVELAGDDHLVEDVRPALGGGLEVAALAVGVARVVGPVRGLDLGDQERGLGGGEVGGRAAEERLRGGLDPVRAASEVDDVEVVVEDLVLGELLLHLHRHRGLAGLAEVGAVAADVGDEADVLLGQRRGALLVAAFEVVDEGAEHASGVDAGVGVEVGVLGGHEGVLDVVGDLFEVHGGALLCGEFAHDGGAVAVVDGGALAEGRRRGPRAGRREA